MKKVRHDFLSGAGFALDERWQGRVGVLADLTLQFLQRGAFADQGVGLGDPFPRNFCGAKLESVKQDLLEILRIAGLCDELGGGARALRWQRRSGPIAPGSSWSENAPASR